LDRATPLDRREARVDVDGLRHGDRALVIHPDLHRRARPAAGLHYRTPAARLQEACGLALAIDLEIAAAEVVRVSEPRPATLIGQGAVDRLKQLIEDQGIALVVVDAAISPVQQRNLEQAWKAKVIDRTGLILEIFGERARTKEGQLQVELAALSYQRSRLVRSWTHLERQRGGFGFIGGPGESQIEIDRRLIDERIVRIKRDLEDVKRTRALHRRARKRVPFPVVALVGYTNAGKSTLFNRLTQAQVVAKDLLFATLDPTMRRVRLPGGRDIILSDTVGFISDLPTELVAAFRATLEEVLEADLILHVRDIAHPETDAQKADVEAVLEGLGLEHHVVHDMIEVLNKIDALPAEDAERIADLARRDHQVAAVSALTGAGCERLLEEIEQRLARDRQVTIYHLGHDRGSDIAWLYQHGEVLERHDDEQGASLKIRLSADDRKRFEQGRPTSQNHT
jgi:GTP-binding protein HflX